ncbi:AAA family ATPase [Helicobacter trogontum]|uniref:AAA family ATPase n=1 Tax=Helicobacter trogontum TaxID=50960 RepID=A0A4V6YSD4_9HELI|nr:AAA family ATPase [Helicobacter trogontum]TLD99482.1 AAA family ATPase [Helicobacter trogontum]
MTWLKKWFFTIVLCIWALCVGIGSYFVIKENAASIDFTTLVNMLQRDRVETILIGKHHTYFYMADERIYKLPTTQLYGCINKVFITKISNKDINYNKVPNRETCGIYLSFIENGLPTIAPKTSPQEKIVYAIIVFLIGWVIFYILCEEIESKIWTEKNAIMETNSYSNEDADDNMSLALEPMRSSIRFRDVAGIKEAKDDLLEIIDYLKNPKKYQDLGIYLPRGVLLVGPPGVGKTMIAKAIAGESGVPFFYHSGSSFVQIYVGVGAQRVRELFARARACAPAIIFIDEIDAIGKARGADNHQEWESTLNELLIELDGFSDQSGVIVIGATNQVDVMDHALLRSGRFDRRIYVDLPDLNERIEILKVHLRNRAHMLDLHETAKLCVGFSGANIASLVNEAAINALRHNRNTITMQDITDTSHKVLFGKRRQNTLSKHEKQMLAIYNAAKGLSQYWLLPDFQKITLIDTTIESQSPNNNYDYYTRDNLIAEIKIALSGNLALEVHNIGISTIAQHDVEKAKFIAKKMCEDYGMGERLLTDYEDILEILETTKQEHKEFIIANKHSIERIATTLIEHEKITKEDIQKILESIS